VWSTSWPARRVSLPNQRPWTNSRLWSSTIRNSRARWLPVPLGVAPRGRPGRQREVSCLARSRQAPSETARLAAPQALAQPPAHHQPSRFGHADCVRKSALPYLTGRSARLACGVNPCPSPRQAALRSGDGHELTRPVSGPSATPTPLQMSADYVGTWTGSAIPAPGIGLPSTFPLTVRIRSGATGSVVGDFVRASPACSGSLVLASVSSDSITVSVRLGPQGTGVGGASGAWMILSIASGCLNLRWFPSADARTAIAMATLVRQGQ